MDIFCRETKPFAPLILNEIGFWLCILKEHALLIYMGLPVEQSELKQEAQQFQRVFENLEQRLCEASGGESFSLFIQTACLAVKNFFDFKRHILHCLLECKICGGCLYPLMLDHMSREAMYFLKLLQKFCNSDMDYLVDEIFSENIFWLRITSEHLAFYRELLDPSERQFRGESDFLRKEYALLGLKARDLGSMHWHYQPTNDLIRFERDISLLTARLQSFQEATGIMTLNCQIVSQINPLLAGHYKRETDHFMEIVELIRKELLNSEQGYAGTRDFD